MTNFLYPQMFLLIFLPFIIRSFLPGIKGLHGDALRTPFLKDIAEINTKFGGAWRSAANSAKYFSSGMIFLMSIWALLVASAARPQWLGEPIRIKNYGRDIMLVMDISTSMLEPDFVYQNRRIDRLTAVKLSASEFIQERVNDRVGLILFGTLAYLQSPITFDKQSVGEILWSMEAGMAGNSTAIGDALGLALKNLREAGNKDDKIIVLLTDGENNDGSLTMPQAISLAKTENIKIYTIGVGNEKTFADSLFGVRVSSGGRTEIDETSLKLLAEETKGRYFRAKDTAGLRAIYSEIDKLEPSEDEDQYIFEVKELFYVPLTVALCLALLVFLLKKRGI